MSVPGAREFKTGGTPEFVTSSLDRVTVSPDGKQLDGHQLLRPNDLSRGPVTRWKILYRSTRQSSPRCVLDYQLPLSGTPHSCFSATIGSSLDALKVGMIDARNAMTMSSMVAAANATGS